MDSAATDRNWDHKYESGDTPWDSQLPSQELQRVLKDSGIMPGRAIELGCGTGTNAVYLAEQGWKVTAVDCVERALRAGQQKAQAAGVDVEWIAADVQHFGKGIEPFDLVFDRGCYHCCRRVDLDGYLETLQNVTRTGSHFLCLCGNPNDGETGGPPRVPESDVSREFAPLFDIIHLRPFHFEDAGGKQGPLGWSVWMVRK